MIELEFEGSSNVNNELKLLARGPNRSMIQYCGCIIDGHEFQIEGHDMHRKTQNGSVVKIKHEGEIIYYSVQTDIIELSYVGQNNLFCFKCDWWDTTLKIMVSIDELKFLSINITKNLYVLCSCIT